MFGSSQLHCARLQMWLITLLLSSLLLTGIPALAAQAADNNILAEIEFTGLSGLDTTSLQKLLDSEAGPLKAVRQNALGDSQSAAYLFMVSSQQEEFTVNPVLLLSLYQARYNLLTDANFKLANLDTLWSEFKTDKGDLNEQIANLSFALYTHYEEYDLTKPLILKDGTSLKPNADIDRATLAVYRVLTPLYDKLAWDKLSGDGSESVKEIYQQLAKKAAGLVTPLAAPSRFLSHPGKNHSIGINAHVDHNTGSGILDYKGGTKTYNGHSGTDYAIRYSDIFAAADGVVEASVDNYGGRPAGCPSWAAWNKPERYIIVRHANGYRTKYWHLSSRAIGKDAKVSKGQLLGKTGDSGCSSGPHAHFEVSNPSNGATDPYGYCKNTARPDPYPRTNYWLWADANSPCEQQNSNVVNVTPEGYFESAGCDYIVGWARDPDVANSPIDVHIYRDGPSNGGTWVGVYRADIYRSDVAAARGDNGNHGFKVAVPTNLKDGKPHSLYIYAIDSSGQGPNPLLAWTPKTITCTVPKKPVYRFYKAANSTHFYTANESEKQGLINNWSHLYKYEGVAYQAFLEALPGGVPVYRFYNRQTQAHLFTTNEVEKNELQKNWGHIFTYEGIAFYAYATNVTNTAPVYRLYNRQKQTHFFTINEAEKNYLVTTWPQIYALEGVGFYVYKA